MIYVPKQNLTYDILKHLGISYWVRSKKLLDKLINNLAIGLYRQTKDPVNSILWYLLLKRMPVIINLLRITKSKQNYINLCHVILN